MGKLKRLARLGGRVARRIRSSSDREEASSVSSESPRRSASWAAAAEEMPSVVDGVTTKSTTAIREKLSQPGGPLLVNHWATWCEGCVDELPLLAELHQRWSEKVEFLGVSWENFQFERRDVLQHVSSFSKEQGAFWPSWVVGDTPDKLFEALEMSTHTIPQIWVLTAEGEVVYRLEEVLDASELQRLEAALEQVTS